MSTREEFEQRVRTQLDVISDAQRKTAAPADNLLQATAVLGFQMVEQGIRSSVDLFMHSARVMIPLWQASLRLSLTGFELFQNSVREMNTPESPTAAAKTDEPASVRGIVSFPPPPSRPASAAPPPVTGSISLTDPVPPIRPRTDVPPAKRQQPPVAAIPTPSLVEVTPTPPQPAAKPDIAALAPENSFYFQGAEGQYNLAAHNLTDFLRGMAEIDDAAWLYHLHRGDYTNWFRHVLHDEGLAAAAEHLAQQPDTSPIESREQLRATIQQHYAITL